MQREVRNALRNFVPNNPAPQNRRFNAENNFFREDRLTFFLEIGEPHRESLFVIIVVVEGIRLIIVIHGIPGYHRKLEPSPLPTLTPITPGKLGRASALPQELVGADIHYVHTMSIPSNQQQVPAYYSPNEAFYLNHLDSPNNLDSPELMASENKAINSPFCSQIQPNSDLGHPPQVPANLKFTHH